jgi:N-formylglutamate deformylase
MSDPAWLHVTRGKAPLIVSIPHTGLDLAGMEERFNSPWLARKDADWRIEELYDFARGLGATIIRTTISRAVIDVNRDPSGASLYPGLATTELCPTTTFDGEPLYRPNRAPSDGEIDERRRLYFQPYHSTLRSELARLRGHFPRVALYDCHSIRSRIPRLFAGELPAFNLGTNSGASADPMLISTVADILRLSGQSFVVDGRFKGGWITRSFGAPAAGVNALQMEIACRAYMREPAVVGPQNWPTPYEEAEAAAARVILQDVFSAILRFTEAISENPGELRAER